MDLDVGRLVLVRGSNHPGKGFSAMEAVAFAAGEAWSVRPRCASPAITEWMIAWNDGLDDVFRQSLRRYIRRLTGSRGTRAHERARQWMVADWLVRSYTPSWLAAAGLGNHADRLARLGPLTDAADVAKAWPTVRAAGRAARAQRDQAWRSADTVVAAHDWGTAGAVWSAIADATWGAAGNAARAVVWTATDPTAPGRVAVPMWDTACDAAADAAGALAWVAVRDAARRHAAAAVHGSPVGPGPVVASPAVAGTGGGAGRTYPLIDPLTAEWTTLVLPVPEAPAARVAAGPASAVLAPVVPVAAWVPQAPTYHHPSAGGAGPDLPVTHPPSPVGLGGGHGHHHSHGEPGARSGRGCRACTVEAGRAPRESTCAAVASTLVSGDQGMGAPTSSESERRDSSPVVETRPDAAEAPAADDMEEPDALAEADDPSESDDMWQLAWETARAVLAPTSAALQASAHDLVDRLIAVTE